MSALFHSYLCGRIAAEWLIIMNTTYNPQEPSTLLINEIKYYMAFSALKKLFLKGLITKENCEKANVAIAEKYGVLEYYI